MQAMQTTKRSWMIVALVLTVGGTALASGEFFDRNRLGSLAGAHEAFLDGDHRRVAPLVRSAIREAAGDPEITRSGLALLEKLYAAREGRPVPVDWELHPNLDRLKVSVVRRENAYWTEYGLRLWGKEREAGLVHRIRVVRADGEVVLDREEGLGTWWTMADAQDGPEFELAYWENSRPPADGLYEMHVEFTDGARWDAWFLLSGAVASDTPPVIVPSADEVLETSRPTFEIRDFRTPEHGSFERRSLWYSVGGRSARRPILSHWEASPSRSEFRADRDLPDGDYTVGVFFSEGRRFGPILIERTAGTLVPFTIRTSGVEPHYLEAQQALDDGRPDLVASALEGQVTSADPHDPVARADALRIVARYEMKTGREARGRRRLAKALELYREIYAEGHPTVAATRRLLQD